MLAAIAYFSALYYIGTPSQVYPLQILNAVAVAVTASAAIPLFQDLLPGQAGVATSLYSNALKLGGLLGSSAFALLASRLGNRGLFPVCAAFAAATLALVVIGRPRAEPATADRSPAPRS
jgi:SET family sugar efflux transporter-like MFS transporter